SPEWLSTGEIAGIFADEVGAARGVVTGTFDDGARLLSRSVLPNFQDVTPGDRLQAGVALRADTSGISVHPYLFRLVCKNGAIMAHTTGTERIDCVAGRE